VKLVFPKAVRGLTLERLVAHDMNNFDVRELLPSLFFVIVANGRRPRGRPNDPKDIEGFLDKLVQHERLEGFDDAAGRAMLDRWVRASVIELSRVGKARRIEQIRYVEPLSLLTYKTGLPRESGRRRRVDLYLYRAMRRALDRDGVDRAPTALGKIFREAFGREVTIGPAPEYDGKYIGDPGVDLHTLLALCYLDGFAPTPADKTESALVADRPATTPALPDVERNVGEDLLTFVLAYQERTSTIALTDALATLIDLHMFTGTLKLAYATDELVRSGEVPAAMQGSGEPTPPDIYVDFTRERGSASDEIAQACVDRDLEMLGRYYRAFMYLKTLDYAVQRSNRLREEFDDLENPEYLLQLMSSSSQLQGQVEFLLDTVVEDTIEASDDPDAAEQIRSYVREVVRACDGDVVAAFARLLAEADEKNLSGALQKWYWSVGGLRSDHGLIEGNLMGRRRARYVMSDQLLAVLVQLALIDRGTGLKPRGIRPELSLEWFLGWLHTRFGFIVDRPPAFVDGAGARAAARDNLEAMKRRLRQMGYFQALSDDFAAQYLRDPQRSLEPTP
jgi:hypothetical protein